MITMLGLHDKCPVILAEIIKWITSSARRARRINVYTLAHKCQVNISDLRGTLNPFIEVGLIHPIGTNKKYINKIAIDIKLEHFWREWVLPALDPSSFNFDFKMLNQRTIRSILNDDILKPYCKWMTRKPKEKIILNLLDEIYKSKEDFVLYQNRCTDMLTISERKVLQVISKSSGDLDKIKELCYCDTEQFIDAIKILREKWLIRIVWQEEVNVMRWSIMLFSYEQFVKYIPSYGGTLIDNSDKSFHRIINMYNNGDLSEKENLLLWEYYFLAMKKEWSLTNNVDLYALKYLMEFWYAVFDRNLIKNENIQNITNGLFMSNKKTIHVLVLPGTIKLYLKFAIKWGLFYKNDIGIMMTTLGTIFVNGINIHPRMVWGRNKDQLTIVLSVDHKWFVSGWLDLIAQETNSGNYIINPVILKKRQITSHQLLFILGSLFRLTSRQKERVVTWIK